MSQKILLTLAALFMVSCGPPEFEKNTRILVKGNIVDGNNDPIANREVNIYTERAAFFAGNHYYLLGSGRSNNEGAFAIVSFFDQIENFRISIDGHDGFGYYGYSTDTENYVPEDLTFNLETITLKRRSVVNYSIVRESAAGNEIQFSFKSENPSCYEVYEEGVLNELKSNCYNFVVGARGTLNDNLPEVSGSFNTTIGSTVEFRYSINGQPEIVETIVIDRENYVFNFSY